MTRCCSLSASARTANWAFERITLAEAVTLTAANRNTLKGHFKMLCERGLLVLHGRGRGTWYGLP